LKLFPIKEKGFLTARKLAFNKKISERTVNLLSLLVAASSLHEKV